MSVKPHTPQDQRATHTAHGSPATGNTLTFLLLPSGSASALAPAWAVLCGACAAGSIEHREALDAATLGPTAIALALTIFIAQALWSSWRMVLVDMDWSACLASPPSCGAMQAIPYVTPHSPLGRLLGRWSQVRQWMREAHTIEQRGGLLSLLALPALILLVSAAVGRPAIVLSLAALALILLEWRVARRRQSHTALQAGLHIGLSWLAGHTALAPLYPASLALACCYAIAYQGALALGQGRNTSTTSPQHLDSTSFSTSGTPSRAWALSLLFGGQGAAITWIVLREHPLAATILGLLAALELLLLVRLDADGRAERYLGQSMPILLAAMAVGAWFG
jgi:hypothetical protein